jgi:hypothetical protein
MVSVPAGSAEVVHVAVLKMSELSATRAGLHSVVLPFIKTTVPVAGRYSPTGEAAVPNGALAPSSFAVNVTAWPCGEGLGEPLTVIAGVSRPTTIVTVFEVDPR